MSLWPSCDCLFDDKLHRSALEWINRYAKGASRLTVSFAFQGEDTYFSRVNAAARQLQPNCKSKECAKEQRVGSRLEDTRPVNDDSLSNVSVACLSRSILLTIIATRPPAQGVIKSMGGGVRPVGPWTLLMHTACQQNPTSRGRLMLRRRFWANFRDLRSLLADGPIPKPLWLIFLSHDPGG